jgi:formyltetrahydrofolate deformylase
MADVRLGDPPFILTLSCRDAVGIVADVAGFLAQQGGFIVDSQQYADLETGRFFMRVAFVSSGPDPLRLEVLRTAFAAVGSRHGMDWTLADSARRARLLIAVSKHAHCLNDLLHRWSTGALPVEVVGVFSNHPDMRALTEWHGVPYHHLPVTAETRAAQEAQVAELVDASGADLVALARYMQVLGPDLAARLAGRCINIHHSFLPSFKGAKPYHRAHARGVKLIGATAHYVTGDLDEGPIIEQAVDRVDHRDGIDDLIRIGRDIEAQVLARAVKWQAERRILLNGAKTVVFR